MRVTGAEGRGQEGMEGERGRVTGGRGEEGEGGRRGWKVREGG